MKIKLIMPRAKRLFKNGSRFRTPPLGLTMVAALTPKDCEVTIEDENVEELNLDEKVDLVGISSFTSKSVRLGPPVMFTRRPVAPSRVTSSSSGELMAACMASTARLSPEERPVPISAMPWLLMMVRTSAKSTLTMPCTVIRSEMPCTALPQPTARRARGFDVSPPPPVSGR